MSSTVEIDEIDVKILRELIKDARAKAKDIAKTCSLSAVAILNRIKRLKAGGVIVGALMFNDMSKIGDLYPASIGVNVKPEQEHAVAKVLRERTNLVLLNPSAGNSSFNIFFVAKSLKEIEYVKQLVGKKTGTSQIAVSLWTTPYFGLENIDLQPTRS
jgi:Lrp/AsnC family transcriptional regulator for asnA, asnC and gidA